MTMTPQNHYNQILMTAGGQVAGSCCCGTEEDTTACSLEAPCANGWPSMQLTVFDADYAGGDIIWCGKTWTQSEVQAGKTECACPTSYFRATYFSSASDYTYSQFWAFSVGQTDSLLLVRIAKVNFFGLLYTFQNQVKGKNAAFHNNYNWNFASPTAYGTVATPAGFTPLNPVVKPNRFSSADNKITDEYFTSVIVGGVTYSWDRGVGWP